MTNVTVNIDQLLPQAGSDSKGRKIAYIDSAAKAAQSDTVTLGGATSIVHAQLKIDATGATETHTLSTNVITLTSATTGAVSGIVIYR